MSVNKVKFVVLKSSEKDVVKAVVPKKGTELSMGYDLTAIGVEKKVGERITLYKTGIAVQPPKGYYTEIYPRSSMSKTGYMLANSIGLIDPDYTGELFLALIKVDPTMPDLQLPFTKCQLVLKKCEDYVLEQVESLESTARGDGGFGSTDKRKESNFKEDCKQD